MRLTSELAQPIVDRTMAILQRNINIMDEQGVIVASGDPARLGQVHQAAAAVLRTGRRIEVETDDGPRWEGARAGVNLALRLNGKRVGVVGITGPPAEVRPFGEVIREMVQLMLVQAEAAELERTAVLAREAFLHDLLTGTGEPSERMGREAQLVGLRPEAAFQVVLCKLARRPGEVRDYRRLEALTAAVEPLAGALGIRPMITGPWQGRLVIICETKAEELAARLWASLGSEDAVAVGLTDTGLIGLRRSFQTAVLALDAGRRLGEEGPFLASALRLETLLASAAPAEALSFRDAMLGQLPPPGSRQGDLLRQTAEVFARSALSLGAAAEALGIHRHTLSYRLEQINTLTGQDPRTWAGALGLYLGLKLERYFGQMGQGEG